MGAKINVAVRVCLLPVYGGGHSFSRSCDQYIKECDLAFTLFFNSELYRVTYTVEMFKEEAKVGAVVWPNDEGVVHILDPKFGLKWG